MRVEQNWQIEGQGAPANDTKLKLFDAFCNFTRRRQPCWFAPHCAQRRAAAKDLGLRPKRTPLLGAQRRRRLHTRGTAAGEPTRQHERRNESRSGDRDDGHVERTPLEERPADERSSHR